MVDGDGIAMDPAKVDSIIAWKVPSSKELLAGFLGAVGYLALGCLTKLTGKNMQWHWMHTEQHAFDEICTIVQRWQDVCCVNLNYASTAPINLTCDACNTGSSGVISQGTDLHSTNVVAFWSRKFNLAQQNYPVHEQELLAIIESLK